MKKVKNLMIGALVFSTSFLLVTLVRRKDSEVKEVLEKEEEIERNYIDISEQLKDVKKENKELKKELDNNKKYA